MDKKAKRYLIYATIVLCAVLILLFPFQRYKVAHDPVKCFFQYEKEFYQIAEYLGQHPARINMIAPKTWPEEIKKSLQILKSHTQIESIYVDVLYDGVHFSFPVINKGKDGENTDVMVVEELIYCDMLIPSVFTNEVDTIVGKRYYEEQLQKKLDKNWYIGTYRRP